MDKLSPELCRAIDQRLAETRRKIDQRTAATLTGYTILLSEIIRLVINKGVMTADEVEEAVTEIVVRGKENGAEAGFDSSLMHVLAIIKSWDRQQVVDKRKP